MKEIRLKPISKEINWDFDEEEYSNAYEDIVPLTCLKISIEKWDEVFNELKRDGWVDIRGFNPKEHRYYKGYYLIDIRRKSQIQRNFGYWNIERVSNIKKSGWWNNYKFITIE